MGEKPRRGGLTDQFWAPDNAKYVRIFGVVASVGACHSLKPPVCDNSPRNFMASEACRAVHLTARVPKASAGVCVAMESRKLRASVTMKLLN